MKLLSILFTLLFPSLLAFQSDLPEPYRSIELLPPDNHSFYCNRAQLQRLIPIRHVKTIIEVGSWLGCSTIHMASLVPPDGKVWAVDHWLGSVEHQPGGSAYHKALPYLYQQFLSNVIHAQMAHKIIPVRMDSLEAAKILDFPVDLVYIDAGHDTQAVYNDLCAYYPRVRGHGLLCGDDWSWGSIREAVYRFAQENNMHVEAMGNFWALIEH